MSTPVEITNLISDISPENIEKFCRLKFSEYDFERTQTEGGYYGLDYSEAKVDPAYRSAVRQFIDATKDCTVKVIGKFKERNSSQEPIYVYSVPMKGSITSRSSKKKQADFARHLLKVARYDLAPYAKHIKGWDTGCIRALFFFHDEQGNFRLSLIDSDYNVFRRFTYFVEQDTTGTKNRSFRYRMTNAANDKAAKGEVERWTSYHDIKKAFSVEELTKEFYKELFAWYERAVASPEVIFPCETAKKKEGENEDVFRARVKSEQVIRLITRLLFVWFIKQKNLVPNDLFDRWSLEKILKSFELTKGDNYYRAILQNLFFATLNSEIDCRAFAADGSLDENREHFDIKTLYRYSGDFAIPKDEVLKLFCSIPFLNGGLFECLDRGRDYYDGFSRNRDKVAHVPNAFFFDDDEKTLGLIPLLQRYNFTIDENAHDDQDIALDPELLGKVFENLLGAFNPETSTTARNATGSFYTPREIVNYMVDESLIAYLLTKLQNDDSDQAEAQRAEHEKLLRQLFADGVRPADEALCHRLDTALTSAKILDPACGSGAFPMGMLLRMVELLRILRQIPPGASLYDLKLQLIENCIYGVDIQCIAVQISKLRFFISLVCEQTPTEDPATNYGINPLPNLETKFVAADSLIGLPDMKTELPGFDTANIGQLKTELWDIRHRHFQARTYREKKKLRQEDEAKRNEIKAAITNAIAPNLEKLTLLEAERARVDAPDWQVREKRQDDNYLITDLAPEVKENTPNEYDANARKRKLLDADIATEKKKQSTPATLIDAMTRQLTDWNPYDQNASSPYFDPEWMFNVTSGFDVVIGNPPYIKEYTNKKAFTNIKGTSYYMGKMDIWYYFACKGIDMLTNNGLLCFIATNNWITSTGAKKLRTKVINDTQILKIIDFGAFMIFDNADIQTMVMQFRRDTSLDTYTVDYRRLDKPDAILDDALALLKRVTFQDAVYLSSKICRSQFSSHSFSFVTDCVSPILTKIDNVGSFKLNAKEIGQGVVIPQDCLNKDCQKILGEPHFAGEGIFVLSTPEINDLNLTKMEMSLIRPYFTSTQVQRYVTFSQNTHWIIYTGSSYKNSEEMDHYPHLKNHLDRFQDIITSDNKPYGLHRARNERFFMGEKIVALRKCVDRPLFSYSDFDCYVSATFYVIKTSRLNCKYLLGILNSNLIAFWLRFRGKMQGENFQLDKEPLLNIPIVTDENESSYSNSIEGIVNRILATKKADPSADTSVLEAEIDTIVYRLYGLTSEEIAIVEAATAKALASGGKKRRKKADQAKSAAADDDDDDAPGASSVAPAAEPTGASSVAPAAELPAAASAPKRRGRPPRQQQPTEPPAAPAPKRGDQQTPGGPVFDL